MYICIYTHHLFVCMCFYILGNDYFLFTQLVMTYADIEIVDSVNSSQAV